MSWAETKVILDAIVENGIRSANGMIVMIPMDANKYGYNLKLYDIDGITPLADVKINGVTDPNTEIRTNAQGTARFISGSPSHSISFSEFPSDYQYADIFTARTIRGYINDMTSVVVAPDISQFAGFNITLLDNTGANVANQSVRCTQNGTTYTTDSSGRIPQTIYSNQTSLTFTWSKSGKYNPKTVDGSLQSCDSSANYSANVTGGIIGSVVMVNSANASVSYSGIGYRVNVSASTGQYVTIGTRQYVIAHVDSDNVYVALRYQEENTGFGSSATYSGSTIASKCTTWYNSNVPTQWKSIAGAFNTVNTEGVEAQCFIPTYSQLNGGWTLFNSNSARIFKDSTGNNKDWWTSSKDSSSSAWYVDAHGGIYYTRNLTNAYGFRPALAIKRSLFS